MPGHHVVTLEAEDSDGLRTAAAIELDVVAELPQALVLAPRITAAGAEVELDAGGARVGDVTWRWAVASRPADSDGHLLANDGEATVLTTDAVGTYVVELVVRDGQGNVAVTRFTITAVARGDCNADGTVDGADRVAIVSEIFAGGAEQCDANGDGVVSAADLVALGD